MTDPYDLWMRAGGHPDLYRRLCIEETEEEPLPDLPHEPLGKHCGVGGVPKPERPHYRKCSCGQWYFWTSSKWVPGRPSAHWLRHHGLDAGQFWDTREEGPRFFEEFAVRRPSLLMILRYLLGGRKND